MNKTKFIFLLALAVFVFSCTTQEAAGTPEAAPSVVPQAAPKKTPEVPPPPPIKQETEYDRAIGNISDGAITVEAFEADRRAVMETIEQLYAAMKSQDYQKWLSFLSPSSVKYWSNPRNLAAVTLRLPVRGQVIRSLIDYFFMIFIPSRSNTKIDEIRYVSPSLIKAVQVDGGRDIIYYTFEKINEKWLLTLDTLE